MKHDDVTNKIIKAVYKVYNTLGYGFLEKVYERAVLLEWKAAGLHAEGQKRVLVYYYGQIVGDYNTEITVNEVVICELKAADCLCEENEAPLINYLNATTIEVGLLLNFGRKPEIRRKIFDNDRKSLLKGLYE